MNCSETHEKLNALIDRELGIKDWVSTRLHLIQCPKCRQRLCEYKRLTQASKALRSISKRRTIRTAPIFATAALVAIALAVFWPKPNRPQALVYDQSVLTGKTTPVNAIYSEGDHLVVRDPKSGFALARASGHTRKDAFYAISAANRIPLNQPEEFVVDRPSIAIKKIDNNDSADIVLLIGDPDHPDGQEQVIVFFSGDVAELKKVTLPSNGPAYFVKIIDPSFLSDLDSDRPFKKYVSPSNNRPRPINR